MLRRRTAALAVSICALSGSWSASAEHLHRFEPTDLDMQPPGLLNFDLQIGAVATQQPVRLIMPDFEANLGLSHNVELDVDGMFGLEGESNGAFKKPHATADNVWISTKIGLWGLHDDAQKSTWAVGVQFGPKLPTAPDAHGCGYEALLLIGRNAGPVHLVLNAGGLIDPGATVSTKRPYGVEGGLDLNLDLNADDTFSILAEVGGVAYLSGDPHELALSGGLQWSPSELLDMSLVGLVGFLPGSDRFGVLLGVSPKFRLWR